MKKNDVFLFISQLNNSQRRIFTTMTTKIKLRDIINVQESYSKLLDQSYLPVKTKYTLSKDGRKITDEITEVSKLRNDLILKYGEKGKDNLVSIAPNSPNMASFQLEYDDLMDIELVLLTDKIDIELFMRDDCTLSAKDFILLNWMIYDKDDVKEVVIKDEENK